MHLKMDLSFALTAVVDLAAGWDQEPRRDQQAF